MSHYVLRHKRVRLTDEMLSELGLPCVAHRPKDRREGWRGVCMLQHNSVAFHVVAFVSQSVIAPRLVEFLAGAMLAHDPLADDAPHTDFKRAVLEAIHDELLPSLRPGGRPLSH